MEAIHDSVMGTGTVWSIDMDHKSLTHKFYFRDLKEGLCFTPDNKYIVTNTFTGLEIQSIVGDNSRNTIPPNFW